MGEFKYWLDLVIAGIGFISICIFLNRHEKQAQQKIKERDEEEKKQSKRFVHVLVESEGNK